MKKYFALLVFAFLFLVSGISNAQLLITSMKDIVETVSDKIKYLEDNLDQEVVNITIDLLVGSAGEKTVYRNLDNSFDYKLILIGDKKIAKLKIEVNKKTGDKWILVDKTSGENVTLDIFPDNRALYEFIIKADTYNPDYTAGHFAFILYHKDPLKK